MNEVVQYETKREKTRTCPNMLMLPGKLKLTDFSTVQTVFAVRRSFSEEIRVFSQLALIVRPAVSYVSSKIALTRRNN